MTAPRTGGPDRQREPAGRLSSDRSRSRMSWFPASARRPGSPAGTREGRAHDVELHAGVDPVGAAAPGRLGPAVADEADPKVQLALGELLALARRRAAHHELKGPGIPGAAAASQKRATSSSGLQWVADGTQGPSPRRGARGSRSQRSLLQPAGPVTASVTASVPAHTGFPQISGFAYSDTSRRAGPERGDPRRPTQLQSRSSRPRRDAADSTYRSSQRRRAPSG